MIGYKQASKQASTFLCSVNNTAYARAYNKIFDISKPTHEKKS